MSRDHRARSLARGHASPRFWTYAVRQQLERVKATRRELCEMGPARQRYDALEIDVHFLLVAIQHILRFQGKYLELMDDDRLRQGLEEFDAAAPDSTHLRNMLEHLDEYVVGEGKYQDKLSVEPRGLMPGFVEASRDPEADFEFFLGDLSIPVKTTANAAIKLGELLDEIWNHHFGRLKSGASL